MSHAFLQISMSCCVSHKQQLSCMVLRTNEFLLFHFIPSSGSTSTLTLVGLTITKCCNILLKNTSPRCSAEECKTQGLQVSSDGHPESLGILRQGWVSFSWVRNMSNPNQEEEGDWIIGPNFHSSVSNMHPHPCHGLTEAECISSTPLTSG